MEIDFTGITKEPEKSNALRPPRPLWLIFFESTQKKLKSVGNLVEICVISWLAKHAPNKQ